jgi:hypothetical protein
MGLQRTAGNLMELQRTAGNAAVVAALTLQRRPGRGRRPAVPTRVDSLVGFVTSAVAAGRIADLQAPLPPGVSGPAAPGGAFWMLNGLNPDELVGVLSACTAPVRGTLLARIGEADGRFDRPRLESALRSAAWGQKGPGASGLTLLDTIRNTGVGSFGPLWAGLVPRSRVVLIAMLRTLDRASLTTLRERLSDAGAADRPRFTEVIADLLGTGTDMQAADVVDVAGLRGLDREMAGIYNLRGQLVAEQAAALGIGTAAAAGIMKAESGGATFAEKTGKTIVRFENHVFWGEWGKAHRTEFAQHFRIQGPRSWEGHEFREIATGAWETFHGDQEKEWRVMTFAAGLSGEEPAFRSASWGAGQIMGSNAARVGFATAVEMARSFNASERSQVSSIFEFIRAGHLESAIRAGDFLTLAKRYNGDSSNAPVYAANISRFAASYQRVSAGKRHVIP